VTVAVGLGYVGGCLMISETTVLMLIAVQFGFMAFVLMKLDMKKGESERFKSEIEKTLGGIAMPHIDIDGIKGELIEVVEDLMQSMRIPSIADHLGGAVAQFMQMKQMKMAQDLGLMQDNQIEEDFTENGDS